MRLFFLFMRAKKKEQLQCGFVGGNSLSDNSGGNFETPIQSFIELTV